MSVLVNLIDEVSKDNETTLIGRTVSRPSLFVGDEAGNTIYVVDVDVGDGGGELMRDVAIASGNNEVRYADVSTPVELKKIAGHWQVVGFAKTMPGTYNRVPVTVPSFTFGLPTYSTGVVETVSFVVRPLTYGELAEFGTYGNVTPYGALGKFQGTALIEVFV
jgi:hypothetical protein